MVVLLDGLKEDNLNKNIKKIISKLKLVNFQNQLELHQDLLLLKIEDEKEYVSKFNLNEKIEEIIKFKTNDQLNQFSSMYFNKIKKNLIIYGL